MQMIFFFYGLAFLVMGIVIFLMPKKNDLLGLSEDLWLVGLFGLLHGTNEWVDLFILRGSPFNVPVLTTLGALLLPLSFAPLLHFGVRTLFRGTRSFRSLRHLWMLPLVGWAAACFLTHGFLTPGILARYFICLPGAFLTAAGLSQTVFKADKERLPGTVFGGAISAAVFFVFYGVLSGLVVPKAGFLPASLINYPNFIQAVGVPVQFFRMICACLLAFSFFALTGIYAFNPVKNRVVRRGGIRRKITLWLSGMVFAVFILFSVSGYQLVSQMREQTIGESLEGAAKLISVSIASLIRKEMEELRIYFNDPEWKEFLAERNARPELSSPRAREDLFKAMDQKWADPSATELEQYLSRPMISRLKNYTNTEERLVEILLTDRYGGLVASSEKTTDFFQGDESWWKDTFDDGKGRETVQDAAWDASSGTMSVDLAVPVRDAEGGVIGIAKQVMKLQALFKYLQDYHIGKTGHAVLVNASGDILFHQGIEPLSRKFYGQKEFEILLRSGKKRGILVEPHGHKGEIFAAFAKVDSPILEANGVHWYVFVDQSKEEILAPLWKIWLILGAAGGVFFLIFLWITHLLASRLAEPLRQLTFAAREVQNGNWEYVLDVHSSDEIQELAESFRFMVQHLRERQSELLRSKEEIEALSQGLERKVEERTKELSESQRATMNILEDLSETNEQLKKFTEELTRAKNEIEAKSRELQRSEEFLKNTGQMAKVGGWELDLRTQAISWTDETYRIHELEVGSTQSLEDAIHCYAPESLPVLQEALRKCSTTGEPFDLELEFITARTKRRIWVRSIGQALREEGKIVKLWGTFQDIDLRKRAELALKRQADELEIQSWGLHKANDGIRALYQELEVKNADLAKLSRLKDDFVSIVAHELRNPLGVVREAAALILDGLVGPVSEEQKKYIEIIRHTGDRLIHITTDLLDLAKIEAGKIIVNYEPMDLLSLVRQSCEGIALRANKKGLTVSQDFQGEKLEIMGDFDKLSQVMINLLSNAFKFTEKGGITVEVRDLGEEVRCAVKDTGPGIAPENLARLFSKFEQFGKPTASSEKGSGLGLVISKSIVEAHGGRIWAESEPGQGTAFIFTLPKKPKRKQKLGEILVEEKALSPEQSAEALRKQNGAKA
jgi:signal transduction histidine kinase/HAMP domain-containing protein